MAIRSFSDLVATVLAWTPILIVLVAIVTFLASGVAHLEARTYGSEYIIPNAGSVDEFAMKIDNSPSQQFGDTPS